MCLILFAYNFHPDFQLILAANRDELYHRPAKPLAFWDDAPSVLAGRDLKEMGTWLGVAKSGRVAAITNFRDPTSVKPDAPTRGRLVSNFLTGNEPPKNYMEKIRTMGEKYNGFNLLTGDTDDLYYYSNRGGQITKILPGMHGLSNHLLDTPWPKVEAGKNRLQEILQNRGDIDTVAIFDLLIDRSCPPDSLLPETGVGLEMERMLAPLFITSANYGTRCSSIIMIDKSGSCTFIERSFEMVDGKLMEKGTVKVQFKVT